MNADGSAESDRNGVIAITGVTGFIGGVVARKLSAAGWRVRGLVRSRSKVGIQLSGQKNFAIVEGSLADLSSLRQLVEGSRAVIHCAGAVRGARAEHFNQINAAGVAALVRITRETVAKPSFLLLSSLAAREPQLSFYAASKKEGEQQLAAAAADMPWVALRPPAVYGPGDRELLPLFRLMEKGVAPLVGAAQARFSMLYVDDLAAAIQSFLEQSAWPQAIYELHDGHPGGYSWDEVVALVSRLRAQKLIKVRIPLSLLSLSANINQFIAQLTGRQPMLTPGKIRELYHPDWVCDNQSITAKSGWQPKVGLEEGLKITMCWR